MHEKETAWEQGQQQEQALRATVKQSGRAGWQTVHAMRPVVQYELAVCLASESRHR
jgi:hypothetical protein